MSYIDVLNDAAARADAASTKAEGASQLLEDIANGPVDSYVATLNGQVPTAATAIDDLRNQITAGATAPILESVTLTVDGQTNITFENIQTSGIAVYIDGGGGSYRYFNFTVGGTTSIVLNDNFLAGTVVHGMSQEIGGQVQTAVDQTQANAQLAEDWAILTGETVDGTEYSSKHHAGEASSSASAAAGSASSAATSETNAAASETAAASSAGDASASATSAASSASTATSAKNAAQTSASNAASSEAAAALSESNAAGSESAAATSETNAKASETAAASSASAAASSESAAATSEANAADSEASALASKNAAQTARTAAETARDQTQAIFQEFGDQYLGDFAADPTVDNSGNPLTQGDIYLNTTDNVLKFYTGTTWVAPEEIATNAATAAEASAQAAAASETNASASESAAAASASSAADSETQAANSASAAAASEQNSASSASDAQGFANDSSNSAVLSKDWATLTTGTVDGAEYSSKYYSQQASSSASSAATSESNAATSESKALTSENAASNSESNALTYSQDALQYRNEAESFSNFVGGWSALTGAKDAPMIAFHNGGYWCLLESVADITSEEPGQSTSWAAFNITRHGGKTYGEDLDGLTFDAMVSRGDYDPSTDTGFFGEVPAATLFTGPEIKTELGITEGTPMNDAEPWLKFWSKGRVLYTNKKPIQHSISWNHIDSRGAVYGTPVVKGGYSFTARLMTGAASDPIDVTGYDQVDSCTYDLGAGSEWNELIYRVHQDEPFCGDPNHKDRHGGPQVGGNWSAMYINADLGVVSGTGRASWCQETDLNVSSSRVSRGYATSVAHFTRSGASHTSSYFGLRLVLALNS